MTRVSLYAIFCMAALVAAMSFRTPLIKPAKKATLVIKFENYVGDKRLKLDSEQYKNTQGQSFTVSVFKYYISNVRLKKADGKEVKIDEYFLVNEEEPASKQVAMNMPEGKYTGISFILGVDSLHNCNGAQSGALDPINGMFWTWNTGYVFLKMEGRSPASNSTGNMLEFHIGGYKEPANCIRTINLNFKNPLIIAGGDPVPLNIKTDLGEMFKTPTTIDFSKLSSVVDVHNVTMIANNYVDMFSIQ